jgi:hypothetical protein
MNNLHAQMVAVLAQFPNLTVWGFENPTAADFDQRRASMLNHFALDEFDRACGWLVHVPKVKRGGRSSYEIKHVVENWTTRYVCNGSMIAAGAHMGFRVEWERGDLNATVGVGSPRHWPLGNDRQYDWVRQRYHNKVKIAAPALS